MLFGRTKKPEREEKPKARNGIAPQTKVRLYSNSLMSCGTPEGAMANASSLQSLMQEHPEAQFLTEEERYQIGQYLFDLGNRTPEKAKSFFSLAAFFGYPAGPRETKGPEAPAIPDSAPPRPAEPVPPQPAVPAASAIPEGFGASIAEVVAHFQDATPTPHEELAIERGVEPGKWEGDAPSAQRAPPAPLRKEPTTSPPELPSEDLSGSGGILQPPTDVPEAGPNYAGEETKTAAAGEPSRGAKERYYSMYADFANKIETCAASVSLTENRKALALGSKLEKLLQEKRVALPMEDAVTLRRAFSGLRKSLAEKGGRADSMEALRLAAAFGDEDAAKACGDNVGPKPAEPAEEPAPSASPAAQPQTAPVKKGRPYDAPIDAINALITQEAVGREDLEQALGPAAKLEAMIREGAAVPLKGLKDIATKASELGNGLSAQGRWEEARLAYKLALYFTRDKQAAYEYAAARAEEARIKQMFVGLSKAEAPTPPAPQIQKPQGPEPATPEKGEEGPKIMQGSAEAYQYLMQSGPGLEAPPQPKADRGPQGKPKFSDKYLLDPIHAYAVLAGKDRPSPETVLRIIELHKGTDPYTVELARKHEAVQTPEMQARIEKILKG